MNIIQIKDKANAEQNFKGGTAYTRMGYMASKVYAGFLPNRRIWNIRM
jgi:hypothetical protein